MLKRSWKFHKNSPFFSHNPVMRAQTELLFTPDKRFGHAVRGRNNDFIGEHDFITFDEMVAQIKHTKKKVVLNIGDSSTSGWDGDVITRNREIFNKLKESVGNYDKLSVKKQLNLVATLDDKIEQPFFRYKTYSDYIRNRIGDEFIIINAGVPAHTSTEGKLRFYYVTKQFIKKGINIDYVTIYYGNNDCAWSGNHEDKIWVGVSLWRGIIQNLFYKPMRGTVITRCSEIDYAQNLREIIAFSKKNNISPILIIPPLPYYWKPGKRVETEELQAPIFGYKKKFIAGGEEVYLIIQEALRSWKKGNSTNNLELKKQYFESALENDYLTPRIKRRYVLKLMQVAYETNTHLVQVDIPRDKDDGFKGEKYFSDYCHPIGRTNHKITNKIVAIIDPSIDDDNSPYWENKYWGVAAIPDSTYTLY